MNKKMNFNGNQYCVFKDNGIEYKGITKRWYIPYESITKIYLGKEEFVIQTIPANDLKTVVFLLNDYNDKNRQELKECVDFVEIKREKQQNANAYKDLQTPRIISVNKGRIFKRWLEKNIEKNFVITAKIVAIILAIVLLANILLALINDNTKDMDRFNDTFNKDPNTWTEEEKDYVNDLFDYIEKNK